MSKAIRDAYGEALVKYGGENKNVVVLDADLSSSTKSGMFKKVAPERFFNVGIAEYNMVGMAAGFASAGKIPFANTFAVFLTTIPACANRSLIAYSKLNVKLMGAYGGLSDSYDGPSHHAIEDIAYTRALPNFTVLVASDEVQTDWIVKAAIETYGPMYIRLSRGATPKCYDENTKFEIGKGIVVKEGTDATVIACGVMVSKAIEAAKALEAKGINVRVVDMFTIKPLDRDIIIKCAAKTGAIITAEEHSIIGGLGSAVAEVIASERCNVPFEMVGVKDTFTETGDYEVLLKKFEIDSESIEKAVERAISRK